MRDTRAVVAGRRRSQAEAEGLVRDFEQSGLTRKAFCEARGVALHRLDYYRNRERTRRVATPAEELLPVELIGATPAGGSLRVELANGRRVDVAIASATIDDVYIDEVNTPKNCSLHSLRPVMPT
jgi:hypothetical protein